MLVWLSCLVERCCSRWWEDRVRFAVLVSIASSLISHFIATGARSRWLGGCSFSPWFAPSRGLSSWLPVTECLSTIYFLARLINWVDIQIRFWWGWSRFYRRQFCARSGIWLPTKDCCVLLFMLYVYLRCTCPFIRRVQRWLTSNLQLLGELWCPWIDTSWTHTFILHLI